MSELPAFTLFKDESHTDPGYDFVKDFHDRYFQEKRPNGISEDDFQQARDQIIQGWVVLDWEVQADKREYRNYSELFKSEMATILIKGHNFQKSIYCLWEPTIVFYCPKVYLGVDFERDVNDLRLDPESFQVNRFYSEQEFYYSDDLSKSWKKLSFSAYARMENEKNHDVTQSTGCLLYR